MKRIQIAAPVFALCLSFLLTGCGKDQALESYKEDMNTFYADMLDLTDAIDTIDPASETAVTDLLANLDALDTLFVSFAELAVPEAFTGAESLADEASENMSQAVSLYHNSYEGEAFDPYTAEAAHAYYERAMKRVEYVGDILSGTVPDDANVTVITEDESVAESAVSE